MTLRKFLPRSTQPILDKFGGSTGEIFYAGCATLGLIDVQMQLEALASPFRHQILAAAGPPLLPHPTFLRYAVFRIRNVALVRSDRAAALILALSQLFAVPALDGRRDLGSRLKAALLPIV